MAAWLLCASPLHAQAQLRFGDPARANYSELHEGLVEGKPAADTLVAILGSTNAPRLWATARQALADQRPWIDGIEALTRLAELTDPASADSALAWQKAITAGTLKAPPGIDIGDLLPALHAVQLQRERATKGDAALLADLLRRVPPGQYDLGDAWLSGRLAGSSDSIAARFLAATDRQLKIRYLTLLSFSTDPALIPLLKRIYIAPDSVGIPPQLAIRASDGLLWIGTRDALQALLDARAAARARGIYNDPRLNHAELDFLGNDSTYVLARTGRWLTDWLARLR
ncbi:MAG TPA: hypothetical protein VMJ30_05760 [Gemmatimonadales bacterium]|nr:hypothetical protein [Gemmatimonadales bacterium]